MTPLEFTLCPEGLWERSGGGGGALLQDSSLSAWTWEGLWEPVHRKSHSPWTQEGGELPNSVGI